MSVPVGPQVALPVMSTIQQGVKVMRVKDLVQQGLVLSLAIGLTACGQGLTGASTGTGGASLGGGTVADIQFDKIEADAAAAELALNEAQAALDNVIKDGRINISGTSESLEAMSLTGIAEKLEKVLNQLYDKITLPVQKAKDVINKARAQIVAALAKLDPANPLHQSMIAKLQEMMARLDGVEARMGGVYDLLATKVDLLIAAVDKLIDRLDTGNPLLLIPMMELQEVRDVIVDFRDKLANT